MSEEETPLPPPNTKAAQLHWALRACAKYLPPILLAVASAFGAFVAAKNGTKDTAKEEAKGAADTSLEAVKKSVDPLQDLSRTMGERLTKLEASVLKLERLQRNANMSAARRRKAELEAAAIAAAVKAATPPPPKLTPVPATLEKAQEAAK
jgi:hypothetical protein